MDRRQIDVRPVPGELPDHLDVLRAEQLQDPEFRKAREAALLREGRERGGNVR